MKKLSFFVAAAAALVLASCGNKTQQEAGSDDSVNFEQSQIEEKIMVELDSIAEEWNKLTPVEGIFSNGKIQLSEEELKAKPDYLLNANVADDLALLSQKYRALGMLLVDNEVANLYKMDTDAYKAAVTKLATDINDPAVSIKDGVSAENVKALYVAEKEAGRINFFWELSAGAIIENLFVISQNTDKFITAFDDESASNITYHIAVLKISLNDLATYSDRIKELNDLLSPLNELNAISVDQLKEQLATMRPQIEKIRAEILK